MESQGKRAKLRGETHACIEFARKYQQIEEERDRLLSVSDTANLVDTTKSRDWMSKMAMKSFDEMNKYTQKPKKLKQKQERAQEALDISRGTDHHRIYQSEEDGKALADEEARSIVDSW